MRTWPTTGWRQTASTRPRQCTQRLFRLLMLYLQPSSSCFERNSRKDAGDIRTWRHDSGELGEREGRQVAREEHARSTEAPHAHLAKRPRSQHIRVVTQVSRVVGQPAEHLDVDAQGMWRLGSQCLPGLALESEVLRGNKVGTQVGSGTPTHAALSPRT
jgi:hypothetical protein